MSRIDNYDYIRIGEIEKELAEMGTIATLWSIEDIHTIDSGLSEDEAWAVLEEIRHYWSAEEGVNWDVIRRAITSFKENQNV